MAHWQCLAPTGCPLPSHSALSRHSEGPRLFLPRCGNLLYFLQGPQTFSSPSAPAVSPPFRLSCAPQKGTAGTQKDLQGTRGGTGQVRTEPRAGAAPRTKGQRGPFHSPGPCLPQTGPCRPGPARLTLRKWSQDTRLQHWPKVGTSRSVLLHSHLSAEVQGRPTDDTSSPSGSPTALVLVLCDCHSGQDIGAGPSSKKQALLPGWAALDMPHGNETLSRWEGRSHGGVWALQARHKLPPGSAGPSGPSASSTARPPLRMRALPRVSQFLPGAPGSPAAVGIQSSSVRPDCGMLGGWVGHWGWWAAWGQAGWRPGRAPPAPGYKHADKQAALPPVLLPGGGPGQGLREWWWGHCKWRDLLVSDPGVRTVTRCGGTVAVPAQPDACV